jgi:PKD domain
VLGASLYRAPQSFAYQWALNGADIPGASSGTYIPSSPGSYTCRVTATNQAGSSSQTSSAHVVTGAALPPRFTNVSQSHRRWREGKALPHIASARPPVGTTFRFTLNESARVRFAFAQRLPGRRVNGRCVGPTANNRNEAKCTRLVTRGALSFTVGAGAHKLRIQGKISKRKRLPLGRYKLTIISTDAAGQHATARLTFTIVS